MATPVITQPVEPQISATATNTVTIPPPPPEGTPMPPPRPRDEGGRFAAPPAPVLPPPAVAPPVSTTTQPYQLTDKGNGTWELNYATGEKFSGSLHDIVSNTATAHVNTKRWAQEQVRNATSPAPAPAVPATPQISQEELLSREYVANLTAQYLGYESAAQMKAQMGQIQQATGQFESQSLAANFHAACPDFNATPENLDKLFEVAKLAGHNEHTITAEALEQAHYKCLAKNFYQARPAQPTTPTPAFNPNNPPPPPIVRSSSPGSNATEIPAPDINMSAETLRANFDRAKAAGLIPQQ